MGNKHSNKVFITNEGKMEIKPLFQTADSMTSETAKSISSNQHASFGGSNGSSSKKFSIDLPVTIVKERRNQIRPSSNNPSNNSGNMESKEEKNTHLDFGIGLALAPPSSSVDSPMVSARMDVHTGIITIPASSLDSPMMHGKGLFLSPMNSPRSPTTSTRNNGGSLQQSPASSRRNSLDNTNGLLPTIHSALNFEEMEANVLSNEANDDYCVCFLDTSEDRKIMLT